MRFLNVINDLNRHIGNSSLYNLKLANSNVHAKLEYENLMGSIKDRPALYILQKAIEQNLISDETVVIESTSGNFGLALAGICKKLNIRFVPVIDPNISKAKEELLRELSYDVVKVTEQDETGGYLLNRIKTVKRMLKDIPHSFNPNQYENQNNYLSYYHTLGKEICDSMEQLDYVFASVSSGGTITGVSMRIKERFPDVKVIAVDIDGSLIFDKHPKKRRIPGIGASMRTPIIENALIDEVIILSEEEIINGCRELLQEQGIFAGGSSGAVYAALKKRELDRLAGDPHVVMIFPDKGSAYNDTIYNDEWSNAGKVIS